MSGERVRIRVVLAGASGETLAPLGEIDVADGDLLRIKLSPTGWSGWEARMRVESDHPLAAAQEPPAAKIPDSELLAFPCEECDGIGCLCWRTRDWQSIENGCHAGCHYCGRNECQPPAEGDKR